MDVEDALERLAALFDAVEAGLVPPGDDMDDVMAEVIGIVPALATTPGWVARLGTMLAQPGPGLRCP